MADKNQNKMNFSFSDPGAWWCQRDSFVSVEVVGQCHDMQIYTTLGIPTGFLHLLSPHPTQRPLTQFFQKFQTEVWVFFVKDLGKIVEQMVATGVLQSQIPDSQCHPTTDQSSIHLALKITWCELFVCVCVFSISNSSQKCIELKACRNLLVFLEDIFQLQGLCFPSPQSSPETGLGQSQWERKP